MGRLPRATRGALMTLGAVALTHCGSDVVVYDDPPGDAASSASSTSGTSSVSSSSAGGGNVGGMGGDIGVDLYGAPSVGGGGMGGAGMGGVGGEGQGGGVPLYGAAPLPDDDDSL